jgi:hypothetical protein
VTSGDASIQYTLVYLSVTRTRTYALATTGGYLRAFGVGKA